MKSTGIVRRINDLGRVIIPKEIRRTMNVRDGDPLEIFLYDGMICFARHNIEDDYVKQIEHIFECMEVDYLFDIKNSEEIIRKLSDVITLLKGADDNHE